MHYLSAEDILVIHARVVDKTGGLHGVRDSHLLASLAERPKMRFGGTELYKGVFRKAAAHFESCAYHHVFLDGNKRAALAIAARFLYLNGYILDATNEEAEIFVIKAVTEKFDLSKIEKWLRNHSTKIKNQRIQHD